VGKKTRRMKPEEPDLRVAIQYLLKREDGPRGGYHAGIDIEGEESLVALIHEHEFLFRPLTQLLGEIVTSLLTGQSQITLPVVSSKAGRA
jgi:hypothetical protein